ncbi:hypothetical protein GON26_19145 [Flavobacterium sp. GA093]|uniref:Uncharacterized protein n=1 Tax=Flavobacterium hydrocarbonoxydans TaxID=2683249 RepID=A0A6I4NPW0_9FLAO|nr:hypothetical protein [Flavobacterium hydrocarbonoxydans]MWB96486.1 hypothetical protein [Flavobacterium hydrocarbonoxydans]
MKRIVLFVFVSCFFWGCSNKIENVEKSFYYWKSNSWSFSEKEKSIVKDLKIKKLYVKFFEIDHNESFGDFPISKTTLHIYEQDSLTIIPTVYIKNEVFKNADRKELDTLADNVNFLINKYTKDKFERANPVSEFQMDCDWTLKTKDNYFYFLKKLKEISKKQISCTLRLYPYKYPEKMGIPPVDKATLMCYNLINPLENQSKNSILDLDELGLYLNKKRKYPLHLDIALPTYSWMQVYQNNKFSKVIYNNHEVILKLVKEIKPMWYEVKKDRVVDDFYLRVGDKIKYEKITPEKINKAIEIIKKNVFFDANTTVTLFHLDEEQLSNYSNETLSDFYSNFSK